MAIFFPERLLIYITYRHAKDNLNAIIFQMGKKAFSRHSVFNGVCNNFICAPGTLAFRHPL